MTRRTTLRCLAAFALAILPLSAEDLNGRRTGTASGPDGSETVLLVLKTAGSGATGSVGPNEDRQFPIESGHFDGGKFTCNVKGPNGAAFHLQLTLDGDTWKGSGTRSLDGALPTSTPDLKRAR